MPGRGPAPKDPAQRRRRNVVPVVHVDPDGQIHGPELPSGPDWHPQTLAWWEKWRRAPQAVGFTEVEWDFLADTALIHTDFWNGEVKSAAELRLRVAKFGATLEDRLRLRLEFGEVGAESSQKPKASRYSHLRPVAND